MNSAVRMSYALQAAQLAVAAVLHFIAAHLTHKCYWRRAHGITGLLALLIVGLTVYYLNFGTFALRVQVGIGIGFATITVVWCGFAACSIYDSLRLRRIIRQADREGGGPVC